MREYQLILLISQDVIFKPFFVSKLIKYLKNNDIKVTKIIEIASSNSKRVKHAKLWSLISYIQLSILFFGKKFISILPIPLKFKWKSTVKLVAKKEFIDYLFIRNLNKYLESISLSDKDIVFSFQHQIIKNPEKYNTNIINCHPGDLSSYRGIKPIFWSMLDKNKKAIISIHHIDAGIDTGQIILEESFSLTESLGDNYFQAYNKSPEAIAKVICYLRGIQELKISKQKKIKKNSYKNHPNSSDIKRFYKFKLRTRLSFIKFLSLLKTF